MLDFYCFKGLQKEEEHTFTRVRISEWRLLQLNLTIFSTPVLTCVITLPFFDAYIPYNISTLPAI